MEIDNSIQTVNVTTEKTIENKLKELYENIEKICVTHCNLNSIAMLIMESLSYNGFKRWHRCRSKEFHDLKLQLFNDLFEYHNIVGEIQSFSINYKPSTIEEHLKIWKNAIVESINSLGDLQREYFSLTGCLCKIIKKLLKILHEDYNKISKYQTRFIQSDWLSIDIHTVDDKLHEKFKEKENEHKRRIKE